MDHPNPDEFFELINVQTLPESRNSSGIIISKPVRRKIYRNRTYPLNLLTVNSYDDGSVVIWMNDPGRSPIDIPLEQDLQFADRYYQNHPNSDFRLLFDKPFLERVLTESYPDFQRTFQIPLTRHGYLPKSILEIENNDHLIIQVYDQPTRLTSAVYRLLFEYYEYQKITPEELSTRNESIPRTALIYLYYGRNPDELKRVIYPKSKRPRTRMNLLEGLQRKENPSSLKLTLFPESAIPIYTSGDRRYIPITRYGAGMRRGQFQFMDQNAQDQTPSDDPDQNWCGTFYYYEPDSNFFLSVVSNRYLFFDNKYTATKWFAKALSPGYITVDYPEVEDLLQTLEDRNSIYMRMYRLKLNKDELKTKELRDELENDMQEFLPAITAILPTMGANDINTTPESIQSLIDLMKKDYQIDLADAFMSGIPVSTDEKELFLTSNDFLLPDGTFASYLEKFYSKEDVFDQSLCRASRYLGFDVIVLTKMVGSGRTVIEVLDTRTRDVSFKSIYEIVGQL